MKKNLVVLDFFRNFACYIVRKRHIYYKKTSIMIEYIKGELTELTPTTAIIEAGGVGYEINIALPTYSALAGKEAQREKSGETVKLFTQEIIREDAHLLYGFTMKGERELFMALTSVSGIGPNTGRMIMSGYTAAEIRQIIATGNVKALSNIKGIGGKTAQRIIVDLKDVVLKIDLGDNLGSRTAEPELDIVGGQASEIKQEAVSALTMLGFPAAPAGKVVDKLLKEDPTLTVEKVIKMALKML